jgi:hypothetical protein
MEYDDSISLIRIIFWVGKVKGKCKSSVYLNQVFDDLEGKDHIF